MLRLCVPEDCPLDDAECPGCGEPFRQDEWDYEHGGDAWGGMAVHECPNCGEKSVAVYY